MLFHPVEQQDNWYHHIYHHQGDIINLLLAIRTNLTLPFSTFYSMALLNSFQCWFIVVVDNVLCVASPTRNFNNCCHSFVYLFFFFNWTHQVLFTILKCLVNKIGCESSELSNLRSNEGWLIIYGMDAMGLISYNGKQDVHVFRSPCHRRCCDHSHCIQCSPCSCEL